MKYQILLVSAVCAFILSVACTNRTIPKAEPKKDPFPVKYENALFSISMPVGWKYDDSGWGGLYALDNHLELYTDFMPLQLHIVKAFLPVTRETLEEVTDDAVAMRESSGDSVELFYRQDSIDIGGYPASVLFFANYVGNDTIIQEQFVTFLDDSHILIYFNVSFPIEESYIVQGIGDEIMQTVKIKKVTNPLENEGVLKKVIEEEAKKGNIPY